jgi:type II secretory pathway predicted ATPase ExeA
VIPYAAAWRLNASPFEPVPDTKAFVPLATHLEGLARLQFIVDNHRSGGALLGPAGTGKTLLLQTLATRIALPGRLVLPLVGATNAPEAILQTVVEALEEKDPTGRAGSGLDRLDAIARATPVQHLVAFVDNADQIRERSTLEAFHTIASALESAGRRCTLLFAGTDRLSDRLNESDSIAQRMQLAWWLHPLTLEETSTYVRHHMARVGRRDDVFTEASLYILQEASAGIPRVINHLADLALLEGALAKVPRIDRETMLRAVASHRPIPRSRRDALAATETAAAPEPAPVTDAPAAPAAPPPAPTDSEYVWE